MKEKYKNLNFSFSSVNLSNLDNELKRLDHNKLVHETDIGAYVLKETVDIFHLLFSIISVT